MHSKTNVPVSLRYCNRKQRVKGTDLFEIALGSHSAGQKGIVHGKLSLNDTPDCLVIQTDLDIRGRICFVAANKLFVVNVNGEYPSILELEVITYSER